MGLPPPCRSNLHRLGTFRDNASKPLFCANLPPCRPELAHHDGQFNGANISLDQQDPP